MSNSAAFLDGNTSSGCFIIGLALGSKSPDGKRYLIASWKVYDIHYSRHHFQTHVALTSTSSCVNISGSLPIMLAKCRLPIWYSFNCCLMNSSRFSRENVHKSESKYNIV